MITSIPIDLLITILLALCSVIGGLLVWIFLKLDRKVDRIEGTISAMEKANAADHALVKSRLDVLDERTGAIQSTINHFGRDLDSYQTELGRMDRLLATFGLHGGKD